MLLYFRAKCPLTRNESLPPQSWEVPIHVANLGMHSETTQSPTSFSVATLMTQPPQQCQGIENQRKQNTLGECRRGSQTLWKLSIPPELTGWAAVLTEKGTLLKRIILQLVETWRVTGQTAVISRETSADNTLCLCKKHLFFLVCCKEKPLFC